MHIAFLVHSLDGKDGWSRYARDLSRALAENGNTVSVLVATEVDDAPWCTQYMCLRSPLTNFSWLGCLSQAWRVRKVVHSIRPDVLHAVAEPYALPMSFVSSRNMKKIITLHGSYAVLPFRAGKFAKYATRRAFQTAHHIISVSNFTKEYLKKSEPDFFAKENLEEKITVIQNGIWIEKIPQRSESQGTPRMILGVGAVKKRKGYIQSVRALAEFRRKSQTPFIFQIIGSLADAAYTQALRAEIEKLQMHDVVQIRGAVSQHELNAAYEAADIFLLLSLDDGMYVEGFVLTFLEAAMHGVPSVGPTTGGCPEAIESGKSGFLADPENASAVAECVQQVLDHQKIRRADCIRWAEAHDIRKSVEKIKKLYI